MPNNRQIQGIRSGNRKGKEELCITSLRRFGRSRIGVGAGAGIILLQHNSPHDTLVKQIKRKTSSQEAEVMAFDDGEGLPEQVGLVESLGLFRLDAVSGR